jgi:hypothetical protein
MSDEAKLEKLKTLKPAVIAVVTTQRIVDDRTGAVSAQAKQIAVMNLEAARHELLKLAIQFGWVPATLQPTGL